MTFLKFTGTVFSLALSDILRQEIKPAQRQNVAIVVHFVLNPPQQPAILHQTRNGGKATPLGTYLAKISHRSTRFSV